EVGSAPLDLFRSLQWHGGGAFRRRLEFCGIVDAWARASFGIPPVLGARIEPLGYQHYAVRRVLSAARPRFILADEVGLGKTIEAGLVLQALSSNNPKLSVLIVAPGSMSRQWFCELYLRFGATAYQLIESKPLLDVAPALRPTWVQRKCQG